MKEKPLSGVAKKVFDDLSSTYKLDENSQMLAKIIATSWAHLQQAERILADEGLIISGRYGQLKAHPCNDVFKSNCRLVMAALRQLNLTAPANNELDGVLRDFR